MCVGSSISISAPISPGGTHLTALITYTVRHCNTDVNQFMGNQGVVATRDDAKRANFRVLVFEKYLSLLSATSDGYLGTLSHNIFYHIIFSIKNTISHPDGMPSILARGTV